MPIQPDLGAVHVNRPLTNISIAFQQEMTAFVADQVFPNIPVEKKTDSYYTFDRKFWQRDNFKKRGPSTESQGTGFEVATDSYNCDLFALHGDISDVVRANADSPINLDREMTSLLIENALIRREKEFAATALLTTPWTRSHAGVASGPTGTQFLQWSAAASDPVKDVLAWKTEMQITNGTGKRANGLVIGQEVLDALMTNAAIIDRLKYGQTSPGAVDVTVEGLRQMFKLDYLLIGSSVETTSAEGAASATVASIIGKRGLLFYRPRSAGLMTASAGYTFSWRGYTGMTDMGWRIKKIRAELIASDRIEAEMAFDQKVVSADLGTFLDTMVA